MVGFTVTSLLQFLANSLNENESGVIFTTFECPPTRIFSQKTLDWADIYLAHFNCGAQSVSHKMTLVWMNERTRNTTTAWSSTYFSSVFSLGGFVRKFFSENHVPLLLTIIKDRLHENWARCLSSHLLSNKSLRSLSFVLRHPILISHPDF